MWVTSSDPRQSRWSLESWVTGLRPTSVTVVIRVVVRSQRLKPFDHRDTSNTKCMIKIKNIELIKQFHGQEVGYIKIISKKRQTLIFKYL